MTRPIDAQRLLAFFDMEDAACFTSERAEVGQSRETLRSADQSHLLSAAWALRPLRRGAVGTLGIHDGAPLSATKRAGSQFAGQCGDERARIKMLVFRRHGR